MAHNSQHHMEEGPLLNERGELQGKGYATQLVRRYDRKAIRAGKLRIKEWDYYCVCGKDAILALTIADNSYMGLDSVTMIDIPMRWQHTKSFMRAFPMGKTGLPKTSAEGDVEVHRKGYSLSFQNDGAQRVLSVHVDNFFDGKPLEASLTLAAEPRDSMVVATPFPGAPKAFYYNQKINCMQAAGQVVFDGQVREFAPDEAMAVLDWGRGVWTYRNTWYWASASGRVQGTAFGMNLGYGFGDTAAATENMLFWDGAAHKLEHVAFQIPTKADGAADFLSPWTVKDDQGRLALTFTPFLDRASRTSALVVESDQHQVFGYFDGKAVLDDGTELDIEHLLGFAEKVKNRW